jgi:GTP-binding protein EngB required for normal cell division
MSEERLDRLEGMMSQLITMVGNLHNSMSDMQKDMKEMQKDMKEMQTVQKEHGQKFESIELKMDKMETKNEFRHQEVLNQIKRLEKDQDFIWEKAVRNERELEIMKRTLES